MVKRIDLLVKAVKNPAKVIRCVSASIDNMFKLTDVARARGEGERLVIRNWQSAKNSMDFSTLAHIQRYEWVSSFLQGSCCLDVGCGSGYGAYYLAKNGASTIIGVDISSTAIKYAQKHYKTENLEFKRMDSLNLKFRDNTFDAVISFDVLEHIDEEYQSKFISEIARVLKDDGKIYIGCPNATTSKGRNPFHRRELTRREFESLLRKFFKNVNILGQDLIINGIRQKANWDQNFFNLSYQNLIVVEEDCDLTYGLLAICRKA